LIEKPQRDARFTASTPLRLFSSVPDVPISSVAEFVDSRYAKANELGRTVMTRRLNART